MSKIEELAGFFVFIVLKASSLSMVLFFMCLQVVFLCVPVSQCIFIRSLITLG
jgi:hypothetical protein